MMAKKKSQPPPDEQVRFEIAKRAWFAYQCLPRDPQTGQPPALRELERTTGVPQPYLTDLFNKGKMGRADSFNRACWYALKYDPRWVMEGIGKPPVAPKGYFIAPCPMEKRISGQMLKLNPIVETLMRKERLTAAQQERVRLMASAVSGEQPEAFWVQVIANAKMFADQT